MEAEYGHVLYYMGVRSVVIRYLNAYTIRSRKLNYS
jgi:hypothetical protein